MSTGVELGIFSKEVIMPVLILTLPGIAGIARYMRAQVLEVLDQDFVRTARAKGLEPKRCRRAPRRCATRFCRSRRFWVSSWQDCLPARSSWRACLAFPGIGRYAFESIGSRDYDGIMAIVLIGATAFILANLLVDIAYGFIDPRIRLGGEAGS